MKSFIVNTTLELQKNPQRADLIHNTHAVW